MNRKVAVLYVLNELGKDYEQQFTKSFKEMGGEITDIEGYEVTEKDFSTPLSKIRETDSDALIIFTNLEGVSIAKTIAKLNIRTKLYGGTTWNSKPNYAGAENILNDLVYPISKVDKNSKYDIFMKLFQDKYGKKPSVEWMAINSYDALNILMQTIAKTGYNGEKIKNYLYKVKYVGLNGEITFDKNGDYFNKVQMMQLKDGKTIAIN
jgi:branched-chain amino acid transport system substrate-binding protein